MEDRDVETALRLIRRNRFLPVPPPESRFVGDGDFRAIGLEFLEYCVRLGGLRPHGNVLDLGCGIGRMALPLTQFLDEDGGYIGIDVHPEGIEWCRQNIGSKYRNFRFIRLDIRHPLYNPTGALDGATLELPFPEATFDLVAVISVFTHLGENETFNYAREIRRILKPGGRCLCTFFLLNDDARKAMRAAPSRLPFDPDNGAFEQEAFPDAPRAAVGYDEATLFGRLKAIGLTPAGPLLYGNWSGRPDGQSFQDLCVLERATETN